MHTTDGGGPTGIRPVEEVALPRSLALEQNYPNPFNPTTTIRFAVPQTGHLTLKVYSVLGDEVATLVHEIVHGGTHEVQWNAENVPSGVYLFRVQAGGMTITRRMVLLK